MHKDKAETKKAATREKKKDYRKPEVKRLGTVRGVTASGGTADFTC